MKEILGVQWNTAAQKRIFASSPLKQPLMLCDIFFSKWLVTPELFLFCVRHLQLSNKHESSNSPEGILHLTIAFLQCHVAERSQFQVFVTNWTEARDHSNKSGFCPSKQTIQSLTSTLGLERVLPHYSTPLWGRVILFTAKKNPINNSLFLCQLGWNAIPSQIK